MCGIIGITRSNQKEPIGRQIYEALSRLEYRGYDSVGIAVIDSNEIRLAKDKGSIRDVGQRLEFSAMNGQTAIGHSRWATHGPPSNINAHPHLSMNNKVVVVHNGIIENFLEMKKELIEIGYKFRSQTDTEIIPHFLENQMKTGKSMEEAIFELNKRIRGTFAIVVSHTEEPERIYAFKKDNPLVLGISEDTMYCASDVPAFLPWTKETITLRDKELAVISPGKCQIKKLDTGAEVKRKPHKVTWSTEAAQKGGYPHHMLKEIHEQPKVMTTQLSSQKEIFGQVAKQLIGASKVITVAAGTAYYASLNAYHTFARFGGPLVMPCIAAEWDSVKWLVDEDTVVMAVSQSGETLDTIKAVKDAKSRGAKIISVVNVVGSSITTMSDEVVYIHAGLEIGVAATKTFIAQSLAMWRIAYALAQETGGLSIKELEEFEAAIEGVPEAASKIIRKLEAQARDLANWFAEKESAFYLGRGISTITALEGALKMKEISYIHAEAYPAGESKHGPIALVEEDYPVVFAIPQDETRDKMMGSVQEMAARGATTVGVIEEGDEEMMATLDHYFLIPKGYSKFLSSIVYQVPLQLLAYYTAVQRGYSPDMPRNLAKSVTVE